MFCFLFPSDSAWPKYWAGGENPGCITLGVALAAGSALLSYTVEFLQFFIPFRDSGWEDVITNSTGSVAGFILFELCGPSLVRVVSTCERFVRGFLSLRRVFVILILYFGLWSAIAIPLQEKTSLSNWSDNSLLVIGNGVSGRVASSWKGKIFQLELWDHVLPDRLAMAVTSQMAGQADTDPPLAAWDFSGPPPFRDARHFLPDLSWVPDTPVSGGVNGAVLDGSSWLQSPSFVSALVDRFQMTGRFSLRLVCEPDQIAGIDSRVVSIFQAPGSANLEVGQEESGLVVWMRTPLSPRDPPTLEWTIFYNIFVANQSRDILLSYDGASLSLYVDGKKEPRTYQPGGLPLRLRRSFIARDRVRWTATAIFSTRWFFSPLGASLDWPGTTCPHDPLLDLPL